MIEAVAYIGSHPGFMQLAEDLGASDLSTQLELATREGLAERGVELVPDARVTLRTFQEEPNWLALKREVDAITPEIVEGEAGPMATVCASVGAGICVAVGDEVPKPERPPRPPRPPQLPRPYPRPGPNQPHVIGEANETDQTEIREVLRRLNEFVGTESFQALVREMRDLPADERARFIENAIATDVALRSRGIEVPDQMRVQLSYFADDRPTLFCVSSKLSDNRRKVTITFDDLEIPQP